MTIDDHYASNASHCVQCLKTIGIIRQVSDSEMEWQPICMQCLNELREIAWMYKGLEK